MSTKCVQMTPFKFYKNRRVTSDVEKAFLDIHNHPNEDIYIGLFFKDRNVSAEYAVVLENNPVDVSRETDALLSLQAELVLDMAVREYRLAKLYEQIDLALDRRDKLWFAELTTELKQMMELG